MKNPNSNESKTIRSALKMNTIDMLSDTAEAFLKLKSVTNDACSLLISDKSDLEEMASLITTIKDNLQEIEESIHVIQSLESTL
jgi:hypothetical protein